MSDDLSPEFKAQFRKNYGHHYESKPPDYPLCAFMTSRRENRWSRLYQCSRKNGHGPHGAWCKQHDPEAVKTRDAERRSAWKAQQEAEKAERQRKEREASFLKECAGAVRQIADGHNDPSGLCRAVIAKFEDGEP